MNAIEIRSHADVIDPDFVQSGWLARRLAIDGLSERDERRLWLIEPAQVHAAAMEVVALVDLLDVQGDGET